MTIRMKNGVLIAFVFFLVTSAQAAVVHASNFGWNKYDASYAFRAAINSYADTIIIDKQESDWIVGPNQFKALHDKTIIFEHGVILRAKPKAFKKNWNCLLQLIGSKNITIIGYGATFQMNKAEYTPLSDGEWRHSISIVNSSNVSVYGLKLNGSGGDGVYIGDFGDVEQNYSEHIYLKDLWCDNHYRQGISVTSAQHLYVENCWFTNSSGTLPMCGVDLEPTNDGQRLVDVVFDNCRITGNAGNGILFSFQHLNKSTIPVDITFRNCYLSNNHDVNIKGVAAAEIHMGTAPREAVTGTAKFIQCMVEDSQWTAVKIRKPADSFLASFDNCVFLNVSQDNANFYNTPIWIEVTDYENPCPRFGGAVFDDCLLSYNTDLNLLGSYGNGNTSSGMSKVQLNNLTVINPDTSVTISVTAGGGSPDNTCEFDYHKLTKATATNVTFTSEDRQEDCANNYSIVNVSRQAENISFPLGLSYILGGDADQGVDYCRMKGFVIIPADSNYQNDTIFIYGNKFSEEPEIITIELIKHASFKSTSLPQTINSLDCLISSNSDNIERKFLVFPNPAKDYIDISCTEEHNGIIKVLNAMGQLVLTKIGQGKTTRINTQGLVNGFYFTSIHFGSSRHIHKFIIQGN